MTDSSNAELMSAFLDGELGDGEAEAFSKWLEDSPDAQREADELRQMLQLVGDLPDVAAPPDFYDKLSRKLRRRRDGQELNLSLISLPFQVLSIIVILIVAAGYLMLEIEREGALIEKDPSVEAAEKEKAAKERAKAAALEE